MPHVLGGQRDSVLPGRRQRSLLRIPRPQPGSLEEEEGGRELAEVSWSCWGRRVNAGWAGAGLRGVKAAAGAGGVMLAGWAQGGLLLMELGWQGLTGWLFLFLTLYMKLLPALGSVCCWQPEG